MGLCRAQILLAEEQHHELEQRAQRMGRSMSDLVRQAVGEFLTRERETEAVSRSLLALDGLEALRRQMQNRSGTLPAAFLSRMREERDHELDNLP